MKKSKIKKLVAKVVKEEILQAEQSGPVYAPSQTSRDEVIANADKQPPLAVGKKAFFDGRASA